MFLIATAAGVLLLGPLHKRTAGYAMIVLGGLLKIYPLVLMVLTVRERPRVLLWVNAAAAAVVSATGIYFHEEVMKVLSNIPPGGVYFNYFGAYFLPVLIAMLVDRAVHPGLAEHPLMKFAMFAALFLAMTGWFFSMVRWRDFRVKRR